MAEKGDPALYVIIGMFLTIMIICVVIASVLLGSVLTQNGKEINKACEEMGYDSWELEGSYVKCYSKLSWEDSYTRYVDEKSAYIKISKVI